MSAASPYPLLLVTAPMVQLNTPYPATAYLKGFLDEHAPEVQVTQADPGLELALRIFSRHGLLRVRGALDFRQAALDPGLRFFLRAFDEYFATVEKAIAFLQGRAPALAPSIAARRLLPEGPSFAGLGSEPSRGSFRALDEKSRAQHVASLYLRDLAAYVRAGVDPRFELTSYGESLASSRASFDPLFRELGRPPTLVDATLGEITADLLREHRPRAVGISVPFPGTVYAALRMGKLLRERGITVILGGGYCNTELRRLEDPRIFDFVDFITYDDGERPLLALLEHLRDARPRERLLRTAYRERGKVVFARLTARDFSPDEAGAPRYAGLEVESYVKTFEVLNRVDRLWTGHFWNKLTLAHGCYWRKCSFCDVSLDYIGRYEAGKASVIADRMDRLSAETGVTGFHFVDEAAPPAILRALSGELLRRGRRYAWWGNVRFDKAFTPELAALMKRAGCVAVTGGLEVASPRVLELMSKGITVEQVARVTDSFRRNGIFVHAYLMYGFPTQTEQETVDSLEVVRQLFREGCLQSAFWHRFCATAHSPVGKDPKRFAIRLLRPPRPPHGLFAENNLPFEELGGADHDRLGIGLRRALFHYMHGRELGRAAHLWFTPGAPPATVSAGLVANALRETASMARPSHEPPRAPAFRGPASDKSCAEAGGKLD